MSWFDQKQRISESDLIAYHLHELPPRRERAVAQALERSAALAADSAAIAATLHAVKHTPLPIGQAAFTRTWAALHPQLKPFAPPLPVKSHWQTPVFAKAAFALATIGVGVVATRHFQLVRRQAPPASSSALASPASSPEPVEPVAVTLSDATPSISRLPLLEPIQSRHQPGELVSSASYHAEAPLSGTLNPLSIPSPQPMPAEPTALASAPSSTLASAFTTASAKRKPHTPFRLNPAHGTDLMLALGGTFVGSHSSLTAGTEPRTFTATHAIAAVASFHQQFRRALGYRATFSYTRPDFSYTYLGSSGNINTRIFEAAGTYVLQGPHRGRLSTAVDAGAALMAFVPTNNVDASYVYRAAGVLGASADYALTRHWSARASYRAQIFRTPDYRDTGYAVPIATNLVVSHEPSVGIVYRFGNPEPRTP